jgi:hypothetical protein
MAIPYKVQKRDVFAMYFYHRLEIPQQGEQGGNLFILKL